MQHIYIPIFVFQICISVFIMSCFANIFAFIIVVSIIGGCGGGGGARRRRVSDSDESGSVGTSVGYRQWWNFGTTNCQSIVDMEKSDNAEISRVLARVGINLKPNFLKKKIVGAMFGAQPIPIYVTSDRFTQGGNEELIYKKSTNNACSRFEGRFMIGWKSDWKNAYVTVVTSHRDSDAKGCGHWNSRKTDPPADFNSFAHEENFRYFLSFSDETHIVDQIVRYLWEHAHAFTGIDDPDNVRVRAILVSAEPLN
jgi:hypothetical protein